MDSGQKGKSCWLFGKKLFKKQLAEQKMVDDLDQHLKNLGTNYRIEWYADTDHGFVFPKRGSIYDKASAEKHYERLLSLFERNLKRKTL